MSETEKISRKIFSEIKKMSPHLKLMNYSFDEEVDQSGKSFCCAYFRDAEANLIDFYISFLDEDFDGIEVFWKGYRGGLDIINQDFFANYDDFLKEMRDSKAFTKSSSGLKMPLS